MSIKINHSDIPLPTRDADISLDVVREAMRALLADGEAVTCGCCGQVNKIYARGIHAKMVSALVAIAGRVRGLPPSAIASITAGGDSSKLAAWELIEQAQDGNWIITSKGKAWLKGEITIPHKALFFNGEVLGFDRSKLIHAADVKNIGVDLGGILSSWGEAKEAAE